MTLLRTRLVWLLHLAPADCDKLPPPVLPFHNVSFSYSGNAEGMLYKNLEFGIDCDSRVALVGPNGAGAVLWRTPADVCWLCCMAAYKYAFSCRGERMTTMAVTY